MTKLLERAFAEAARLPDSAQDAVAAQLLADLEAEQAWDRAFAETSEEAWARLAAFARSEATDAEPLDDWLQSREERRGA